MSDRVRRDGVTDANGPGAASTPTLPVTTSQRWLARVAYLCALAAVVLVLYGGRKSVGVFLVGVLGLALMLAGAWWFLSNRGILRLLGGGLAVAAPLAVLAFYVYRRELWVVVLVVVLAGLAAVAARVALSSATVPTKAVEQPAPRAQHPFLIMNPRSGGGKVRQFGLDEKARALGAEVALLDGPGQVDVAALARQAVADGADLLGVAGGDGTQALVAGIAAEHDLPFVVISAGTRNHFAMDLGLDRDHPDDGLAALTDAVEVRLDLGIIGDRIFVNNASFGAYAEVVQSPEYRDDKRGTTLAMLPDLLSGHRGARLVARVDGETTIEGPQALLVSNNPYESGDLAGLGRRTRLDSGSLGVVAATVDSAAAAVTLLRGDSGRGLRRLVAHEVVVDADVPAIPVGVDGEALLLPTPVHCTIRPGALRVRLPRTRPGIPVPRAPMDRAKLRHMATTLTHSARSGS